jgi:hypothetical protein
MAFAVSPEGLRCRATGQVEQIRSVNDLRSMK